MAGYEDSKGRQEISPASKNLPETQTGKIVQVDRGIFAELVKRSGKLFVVVFLTIYDRHMEPLPFMGARQSE